MAKILNIKELVPELNSERHGKSVGIITGCFDLLHVAHINLFRYAKEYAQILIVGLDSDISIQKSKGITRPITPQNRRAEILSELMSIDYVLLLDNPSEFSSNLTNIYHNDLINLLCPNYIITNKKVDKYWIEKEKRAKSVNGSLLLFDGSPEYTTSAILNKIASSAKDNKGEDPFYYFPL